MSRAVNKFIELLGEDRISAITDDGNEVIIIGLPRLHHFNQNALVKCACNENEAPKMFPVNKLQCDGAPAFEKLEREICLH